MNVARRAFGKLYFLLFLSAAVALDEHGFELLDSAAAAVETGITFAGRSADDRPPADCLVADKGTGKVVAKLSNKWGSVEVPAGDYLVKILPQGADALSIDWGTVSVADGKTSAVKIDSGIEAVGRSDEDKPPYHWYVFAKDDAEGKKPLARVYQRWGFTPLPPGEYTVSVLPSGSSALVAPWGKVDVSAGKVAALNFDSGIELSGRNDQEAALSYWFVYDAENQSENRRPVARVYERWGFTPLRPGKYEIAIQPGDLGNKEIRWGTAEIEAGKVASFKVDSGIELTGPQADSPPLDYWYVYDAAEYAEQESPKYLTYVSQKWGLTLLPPGKYVITIQPGDLGGKAIRWGAAEVEAGKVASFKVDSGIELAGSKAESPAPNYWYIYDATEYAEKESPKYLTYVSQSWGLTPLPPGKYVITIQPGELGTKEIRWGNADVDQGKVVMLKVDSGVELAGRNPDSPPPKTWTVYDATEYDAKKDRKPLTYVNQRWGYSPLRSGEYVIHIEPVEKSQELIRWIRVSVKAGEISRLQAEPALAERLSRVTGEGRKREREIDPASYQKLEEEIEQAIRRGAAWLKTQPVLELENLREEYPTIGVLALVHAGEFERDPQLAKRCVDHLLRRRLHGSNGTYATSLTVMALRDIDPYRYRNRILECTRWLVENQGWENEEKKVWGYGREATGLGEEKPAESAKKGLLQEPAKVRGKPEQLLQVVREGLVKQIDTAWDNSNAQFAVLGLHSAANSGVGIPRESWQRVADHFRSMQSSDGGWSYHGPGGSFGSMTCAGLASLVTARHHLGEKQPALDAAVVSGLEWLAWNFTVDANPGSRSDHYYYLYGLERAGILAGTEFFGEQEWYPVGARYLLEKQNDNGSWSAGDTGQPTGSYKEYLDTCYAILFLRRATLPLEPVKAAFLAVTAEKGKLPAALLPSVEVILDSSGSMKELVGDQPKMKIAQAVMADVLDKLPDTIQLGLRLYGHRNGNEAKPPANALDQAARTNSRLVLPIAPLTQARREKIKEWVDWAAPWGWTPMVYSVLQAKNDFSADSSASKTVVLISDGAETCGGKLEDIGKAYRDSGIDIVIHVVGFDVEKDPAAKTQLMEIAKLGGGKYFSASDAEGLSTALDQALQGIEFVVSEPGSGKQVSRGAVNDEPIGLKPGKYLVQVSGLKAEPIPIELTGDQLLELRLDEQGGLVSAQPENE